MPLSVSSCGLPRRLSTPPRTEMPSFSVGDLTNFISCDDTTDTGDLSSNHATSVAIDRICKAQQNRCLHALRCLTSQSATWPTWSPVIKTTTDTSLIYRRPVGRRTSQFGGAERKTQIVWTFETQRWRWLDQTLNTEQKLGKKELDKTLAVFNKMYF